jgi:hypothetical protein
MRQIAMQVTNDVGLHARPAGEFVKKSAQFKAALRIRNATRRLGGLFRLRAQHLPLVRELRLSERREFPL